MASFQTRSMVGAMTMAVRKRASPVMTWGGGMDWAPIAWRTSARTIMMRMKQVVMSMIDGTRVITVRRIMMLSATESPP